MKKAEFEYDIIRLDESSYLINEFFSTMFVLCGTERALVIDCGTGVGDFKSVVEKITPLPYDVAATHAHVDHIGGRGQFEKLHVSEPDINYVRSNGVLLRKGFVFVNKFGGNNFSGLNITVGKEPELIPIKNGEIFDLGGRTIKAFYTPGHTVGSTTFLDVERRTVYIGDIANEFLLMWLPHCTTIDEMIETMNYLLSMDCYDTIWSSHHTRPHTREDIRRFLAGAQEVAAHKNSIIPLIKTNDYDGAKLIYRTNIIHKK